jgi:hypothetical protein
MTLVDVERIITTPPAHKGHYDRHAATRLKLKDGRCSTTRVRKAQPRHQSCSSPKPKPIILLLARRDASTRTRTPTCLTRYGVSNTPRSVETPAPSDMKRRAGVEREDDVDTAERQGKGTVESRKNQFEGDRRTNPDARVASGSAPNHKNH